MPSVTDRTPHTQDALAANGEYGLLEGRTFALLHPAVMGGLFAFSLYAGYLGYQWKQVRREIGKSIPFVL